MKYSYDGLKTVLTDFNSFNIKEILECGQCFRFTKIFDNEYEIIAHGRKLRIIQHSDRVEFFNAGKQDFEDIWINYFDLNTDYDMIKQYLWDSDIVLRDAIEYAPGIRILNQDPWEALISFIISQNNRIPMIKQVIKNICARYGGDGCFFPQAEQLSNAAACDLRALKTGFRDKYIIDAIQKVLSGEIDLYAMNGYETDRARDILMSIKGVGPKVADCVLLFSLGRREVFPTDVWVKRVMEHFYFGGNKTGIKNIQSLAYEKYGRFAGYAQQYLFYYAREFGIGTK